MALEITISSVISFASATTLLLVYAISDLRTRHISNYIVLAGGIIGSSIVIMTGHLFDKVILHLLSFLFTFVVGYILFRIGAFGGADVKAILSIIIVSPGVEFGVWGDPVLEGILASGILVAMTLIIAYIYSQFMEKEKKADTMPLIPIVLVVFLGLQLLAFI